MTTATASTQSFPHTDEDAIPVSFRNVTGVNAINVFKASHRNASITGTLELVSIDMTNKIAKCKVSWYDTNTLDGTREIKLDGQDCNFEIVPIYTGPVIANIARP